MARFDQETGQLVLQIVYDGAAYSGKTESVESLGRLLKRPVESPEVENGRTLFFDWMEYEGGNRFGRPIACRVLSVPGQLELANRRRRLIREADGIVFVADSRKASFDKTLERWQQLQQDFSDWTLNSAVIVQLNHRDSNEALPTSEMRDALGSDWDGRFCETIATNDDGIRETFVLAVSETLRHHMDNGSLSIPKSTETQPIRTLSPEELVAVLSAGDRVDTQPVKKFSATEAERLFSE